MHMDANFDQSKQGDSRAVSPVRAGTDILLRQGAASLSLASSSMKSALKPDDILRVEPVSPAEIAFGDIIVVERAGALIAHRFIMRRKGMIFTKGDALRSFDKAAEARCVVGRVVSFERNGRVRQVRRLGNVANGVISGLEGALIYGYAGIFGRAARHAKISAAAGTGGTV